MIPPQGWFVIVTFFCGIPYKAVTDKQWYNTKNEAVFWAKAYSKPVWIMSVEGLKCTFLNPKVVKE